MVLLVQILLLLVLQKILVVLNRQIFEQKCVPFREGLGNTALVVVVVVVVVVVAADFVLLLLLLLLLSLAVLVVAWYWY